MFIEHCGYSPVCAVHPGRERMRDSAYLTFKHPVITQRKTAASTSGMDLLRRRRPTGGTIAEGRGRPGAPDLGSFANQAPVFAEHG